uniref:Uncharacterized protein n=1 Tax=Anguilla anguilla TaxID=7936 RepID=A0A0E9XLC9_ANGAN
MTSLCFFNSLIRR